MFGETIFDESILFPHILAHELCMSKRKTEEL